MPSEWMSSSRHLQEGQAQAHARPLEGLAESAEIPKMLNFAEDAHTKA